MINNAMIQEKREAALKNLKISQAFLQDLHPKMAQRDFFELEGSVIVVIYE